MWQAALGYMVPAIRNDVWFDLYHNTCQLLFHYILMNLKWKNKMSINTTALVP